jgi:hypothetical protein
MGVGLNKLTPWEEDRFKEMDIQKLYHWLNANEYTGVLVFAIRASRRHLAYSEVSLEHALYQIAFDVCVDKKYETYIGDIKPYNNPKVKIKDIFGMRNTGGSLLTDNLKLTTPEWLITRVAGTDANRVKKINKLKSDVNVELVFNWPFGLDEEGDNNED